jgi:hypothetical protein
MQVDKIMIIESPVHLWRILRTKEEIIDQAGNDVFYSLTLFMDSVSTYLNGCKCDEEENYVDVVEYYSLVQGDQVISHLINGFECDRIEFK